MHRPSLQTRHTRRAFFFGRHRSELSLDSAGLLGDFFVRKWTNQREKRIQVDAVSGPPGINHFA